MTVKETKVVVSAETSKYERGMKNIQQVSNKTTQSISSAWLKVAGSIYGVMKAWDLAKLGARAEQEMTSFRNMAASYGVNSDHMISDLKRASAQTVDTMTLVQKAGTAMMMGIDPTKISKLMEIARATSKMTGQTVTQAFEDISLAVGRQSKMILDNLGIIVRVEDANKKYADQLGKTAKELTDVEKKQAFLNATLDAGEEIMSRLGTQTKTTSEWFQSFEALASNLSVVLGKGLVQAAKWVTIGFTQAGKTVNLFLGYIFTGWEKLLGFVEKIPGVSSGHIKELKKNVSGIADHFREAVEQANRFTNELLTLGDVPAITAPKINLGLNLPQDEFDQFGAYAEMIEEQKKLDEGLWKWELETAAAYDEALMQGNEEFRLLELEREREFAEEKKQLWDDLRIYDIEKAMEYDEALIEGHLATNQAIINAEKRAQAELVALTAQGANSRKSIAIGLGTALLNFAGVNSKAVFLITKGLEVAQATMAAFAASNLALAQPPGPPWTVPYAAAILKVGLLNAAAIAAVGLGQFAASQNAGATGGGSYVSPTVTTDASQYETTTESAEKRGTLTINIQGDYIGDEGYIEMLAEKISEAVEDRDVTLISSNAKFAEAFS